MNYHALFVIFERGANFKLSSGANYMWRFILTYPSGLELYFCLEKYAKEIIVKNSWTSSEPFYEINGPFSLHKIISLSLWCSPK